MALIVYLLVAAAAYLLGSIPWGFVVGRARGIDLRKEGSGNIGATNALRILGKPAGILVLLLDAFKGYVAAKFLPGLPGLLGLTASSPVDAENLAVVAGLAAVLGHMYTCWLNFKGGKGIATTAGVGIAWIPLGLFIALGSWIVALLATRYVSIASLTSAVALPIGVWVAGGSRLMVLVTLGISLLAIYKHRGNVRRLMDGTEPRFSYGKSKSEVGA